MSEEEKLFDDEIEDETQPFLIKLVSGELLIAETGMDDIEDYEYYTKIDIMNFAKLEFYRDNDDNQIVYFDEWIPGYPMPAITLERKDIIHINYAPEYLRELFLDFIAKKMEKDMKNEMIEEDDSDGKKFLH